MSQRALAPPTLTNTIELSGSAWFRPAVSLTLPIADPIKKAGYKIVQLDFRVPF